MVGNGLLLDIDVGNMVRCGVVPGDTSSKTMSSGVADRSVDGVATERFLEAGSLRAAARAGSFRFLSRSIVARSKI